MSDVWEGVSQDWHAPTRYSFTEWDPDERYTLSSWEDVPLITEELPPGTGFSFIPPPYQGTPFLYPDASFGMYYKDVPVGRETQRWCCLSDGTRGRFGGWAREEADGLRHLRVWDHPLAFFYRVGVFGVQNRGQYASVDKWYHVVRSCYEPGLYDDDTWAFKRWVFHEIGLRWAVAEDLEQDSWFQLNLHKILPTSDRRWYRSHYLHHLLREGLKQGRLQHPRPLFAYMWKNLSSRQFHKEYGEVLQKYGGRITLWRGGFLSQL